MRDAANDAACGNPQHPPKQKRMSISVQASGRHRWATTEGDKRQLVPNTRLEGGLRYEDHRHVSECDDRAPARFDAAVRVRRSAVAPRCRSVSPSRSSMTSARSSNLVGAIDLAHPACADRGGDFRRADSGACCEGHVEPACLHEVAGRLVISNARRRNVYRCPAPATPNRPQAGRMT